MKQGELVEKSFYYAVDAHHGQYRKSFPLPYATHVIEVYKRVYNYGIRDEEILSAALLHDVIEDTVIKYQDLMNDFGKRVADIVLDCSREGENVTNKEKLDFMKSFSNKSNESVIIKVADRTCNVMDFYYDGREHYASWYALQAYPLIDMALIRKTYDDDTIDFDKQFFHDDVMYIENMSNTFYSDLVFPGDIDRILLNCPVE